jgi:hypothetical protein
MPNTFPPADTLEGMLIALPNMLEAPHTQQGNFGVTNWMRVNYYVGLRQSYDTNTAVKSQNAAKFSDVVLARVGP